MLALILCDTYQSTIATRRRTVMGFHVGVNTFTDLHAQVKSEDTLHFNDVNQWWYFKRLLDENVSSLLMMLYGISFEFRFVSVSEESWSTRILFHSQLNELGRACHSSDVAFGCSDEYSEGKPYCFLLLSIDRARRTKDCRLAAVNNSSCWATFPISDLAFLRCNNIEHCLASLMIESRSSLSKN